MPITNCTARLVGISFAIVLFAASSFGKDPLFPKPVHIYDLGGSYPDAVAVADVNGDGKPDVIVAFADGPVCCSAGAVSVMLNNGDGTLGPESYYSSGGLAATFVAVADVNGDGKPDLVVTNLCTPESCQKGSVGVLLGNGDGTFQPVSNYYTGGSFVQAVAVADINGDGKPDLIVSNAYGEIGGGAVGVLLGNGDGTFQPAQAYQTGAFEEEYEGNTLALADVNHDGKLDILVALNCVNSCQASGYAGVFLGNGDGTFQPIQLYAAGVSFPSSIAVGDLNGDGAPDLVLDGGVLLGNGDGTFQPGQNIAQGGYWTLLADIDRDGKLDVVTIDHQSYGVDHVYVGLGNGDGTFRPARRYEAGGFSGTGAVAVADMNGDGKPDLITVNQCVTSRRYCGGGSLGILISDSHIPTATNLSSNLNPSVYGEAVTLTATVASDGDIAPTGTVTFKNGNTALAGTPALVGGVATLTTNHLPVGTLSLTATYKGDTQSATSTSPVLTQVVNKAVSTVTLTSLLNPSTQGKPVMFIAKVSSPTTKATGLVTFKAGSMYLGTVLLFEGKASVDTSQLPKGSTNVTATYDGSADVTGSSQTIVQVVN